MSLFAKIIYFVTNGFAVFRAAAGGNYRYESDDVKSFRDEMFGNHKTEMQNLKSDVNMIGADWKSASLKHKLNVKN